MKKVKALHISNVAFGLSYFLGDQINYLKSNNIEPQIGCSESELLNEFVKKYDIRGFEIEILRKIDIIADLRAIFKLIRFINREKFDYVIGHTPKGALLAMIASWFCGVKNRVYFRHGLVFETATGLKFQLMIFLERLTSLLSTSIVNVSSSILDISVKSKLGSVKKNMLLGKGTCNGVDVTKYSKNSDLSIKDNYNIKDDNIIVGFVGRLVNDKGIKELAEAWKLLRNEYSNVTLMLVGPFEERDGLSEDIKTYLLNDNSIIVTDFVNEAKSYYNVMDIFILPSYREGFPTVVLEASAMELPIITTKATGCIDSIVENTTGIYSDLNASAIKDSIKKYIDNPHLRLEHGKNGRQWIMENFRQEVIWEEIKSKVYKL